MYGFGLGHQAYRKVYLPENPQPSARDIETLPGPGAYNNKLLTIGTEGKWYVMNGKGKSHRGKSKGAKLTNQYRTI